MRTTFLLIILTLFLISCSKNAKTPERPEGIDKTSFKQMVSAVEGYAKDHLKNSKRSVEEDGDVVISDGETSYMYTGGRMIFGEIDDDQIIDAIVPVAIFKGEEIFNIEYLVLLKTGKNYTVIRSLEKILRVIEIKDRVITAEYTDVPPESPYYGCKECTEVIKFRYNKGDLEVLK